MTDYVSPFDETLNLEDNCITLLLKPGHYDILYKSGGVDCMYDAGFAEWTKLVPLVLHE